MEHIHVNLACLAELMRMRRQTLQTSEDLHDTTVWFVHANAAEDVVGLSKRELRRRSCGSCSRICLLAALQVGDAAAHTGPEPSPLLAMLEQHAHDSHVVSFGAEARNGRAMALLQAALNCGNGADVPHQLRVSVDDLQDFMLLTVQLGFYLLYGLVMHSLSTQIKPGCCVPALRALLTLQDREPWLTQQPAASRLLEQVLACAGRHAVSLSCHSPLADLHTFLSDLLGGCRSSSFSPSSNNVAPVRPSVSHWLLLLSHMQRCGDSCGRSQALVLSFLLQTWPEWYDHLCSDAQALLEYIRNLPDWRDLLPSVLRQAGSGLLQHGTPARTNRSRELICRDCEAEWMEALQPITA